MRKCERAATNIKMNTLISPPFKPNRVISKSKPALYLCSQTEINGNDRQLLKSGRAQNGSFSTIFFKMLVFFKKLDTFATLLREAKS
jgi:hypothetical protein